jgi:hypothetical protein
MKSNQFLPAGREAAAETQAKHELMDLVRNNPELNHLVFPLREAGHSWQELKTAVEARAKAARRGRGAAVSRAPRANPASDDETS